MKWANFSSGYFFSSDTTCFVWTSANTTSIWLFSSFSHLLRISTRFYRITTQWHGRSVEMVHYSERRGSRDAMLDPPLSPTEQPPLACCPAALSCLCSHHNKPGADGALLRGDRRALSSNSCLGISWLAWTAPGVLIASLLHLQEERAAATKRGDIGVTPTARRRAAAAHASHCSAHHVSLGGTDRIHVRQIAARSRQLSLRDTPLAQLRYLPFIDACLDKEPVRPGGGNRLDREGEIKKDPFIWSDFTGYWLLLKYLFFTRWKASR